MYHTQKHKHKYILQIGKAVKHPQTVQGKITKLGFLCMTFFKYVSQMTRAEKINHCAGEF